MLARIILGLGITLVCFVVAGRRFYWLSRLIRSGQSAPRRWQGWRKPAEAELVEVAGQRKLLKWTVPGLAHFFTMWGFTVLMLTIIEAYGDLFQRSFHIPLIGTSPVVGFIEDFFATAVLVALVTFTIIRVRNSPKRLDRSSRFYGSHTGAAWMVLVAISLVMITLILYRAAQINTGNFPYGESKWAFASHLVSTWLAPLGVGVNSVLEAVFLIANVAVISGFLVFVVLEAPAHLPGPHQRRRLTATACTGWTRQDPGHGHGERHRGHSLRGGQGR